MIKLENNADNTVVIVEFDNDINTAYMNGYEGGSYNVSVTMFDVDGGDAGLFMYSQKKGWHEVFNKQKEGDPAKKFQATRPFAIEQDSLDADIPQKPEIVKQKNHLREASVSSDIDESLTMQEAKQMIQRAFVIGNIKEWYDGEYKNGDEWLAAQGAEEVAMYIENEYSLQSAYLDRIPGLLNEEYYLTDVLEAYQKGTLTGKKKENIKQGNVAESVAVADPRFYAPKEVKNATELYGIANQKTTNENRSAVTQARAQILLYAHNKGAAETLGITQSELNKKLRTWGGYSANARKISMRINENIHTTNRWTGIESLSWLNRYSVTDEDVVRMVKSVEGNGNNYQNGYMQGNIVTSFIKLFQFIHMCDLAVQMPYPVNREIWIISINIHSQSNGVIRQGAANGAQTDYAKASPRNFLSGKPSLFLLHFVRNRTTMCKLLHPFHAAKYIPASQQEATNCQLHHCICIGSRCIKHNYARFRTQRYWNIIHACTGTGYC